MPQKISVDEIIARRKDLGSDVSPVVKAAKAPASWNKDARSARFVMNAQATDRYGDIVVTAGIDTEEFEKNPVGLLFHNSRTWPVATWSNLEKVVKGRPPRLEGDFNLLPAGGPIKEIDETEWMIANGGIRACSIGFLPDWDEAERILDDEGRWQGGILWGKSTLLECSICAIPASPQSLIKQAGGDMRIARELVEDILDNWHRDPATGLLLSRSEFEKAYRVTVEKIAADTVAPKADAEPAPESEINAGTKSVDEVRAELGKDPLPAAAKDAETPELTDDVITAFAALGTKDCTLLFKHTDGETSLVFTKADEEVADLVMPKTLTISEMHEVKAKVEEKMAAEPVETEKQTVGSITIDVDTTGIEKATEQVNALSALVDSVSAKLAKFFGKDSVEKTAPVEQASEPAPVPTEEEITAAKSKAAATLERLKTKGLIEA